MSIKQYEPKHGLTIIKSSKDTSNPFRCKVTKPITTMVHLYALTTSLIQAITLTPTVQARYDEYETTIAEASSRYNVPFNRLVSMVYIESRFNKDAVSYTGVKGICQITATTASQHDINRLSPTSSIYGMAKILRYHYDNTSDKFTESERWSISSFFYNRGKGTYWVAKDYLKKKGIKFNYENILITLRKDNYNNEGLDYINKINTLLKDNPLEGSRYYKNKKQGV